MYSYYNKRHFSFSDFTITKREIMASVSIIAIMILIGILISEKISEYQMDQNEMYNKAVQIESKDLFEYGMNTNIGNAFVYGTLQAVDTVTYPDIGGSYMSIRKETEEYTMHTRTVTTTINGKTQTRTETYYTWDNVNSEEMNCQRIQFLDIEFDSNKIVFPQKKYIDTIYDKWDGDIRYIYYGNDLQYTGTIFSNLQNQTISNQSKFYQDMNIAEALESAQIHSGPFLFWVVWSLLIVGCVYGFFYIDNQWLE